VGTSTTTSSTTTTASAIAAPPQISTTATTASSNSNTRKFFYKISIKVKEENKELRQVITVTIRKPDSPVVEWSAILL
jgi:hypothetical protein